MLAIDCPFPRGAWPTAAVAMGAVPASQHADMLMDVKRRALPRGGPPAEPTAGSTPSGMFGVRSLQFPLHILRPIQEVFQRAERERGKRDRLYGLRSLFACLETETVEAPPYTFELSEAGITSSMSWMWPTDEETLGLFQPLFEAALQAGLCPGPSAVGPLQLWTATILVRRDTGLGEESAEFHTDYWHEDVPPGFACSILTPLFEVPEGAGGLHYYPWRKPFDPDSAEPDEQVDRYQQYSYRLGHMIAVDGKCLHRTEPYELDKPQLRVLLSLDVHSAYPETAYHGARRSVRSQHDGGAYKRPSPHDDDGDGHSDEDND